jgi:branched-subunit amino acid aminotransferase/4-amino-4-deoxychorismate lyase
MHVFLNGQFVPEEDAMVSVSDRGFLLGDGIYETLPFYGGVPFRWGAHMARLRQGLTLLRIDVKSSDEELREGATQLMKINGVQDAALRLTISRGNGPRGYSIAQAREPVVVMALHPIVREPQVEWRLVTSTFRVLAGDALMQIKSASKVRSVLARVEAEEQGADEALLLNERGEIAEGAATNFFGIERGTVYTPPIAAGLLPGVTRAAVLEVCARLEIKTAERAMTPREVKRCDGAFATVSTMRIVEATALDGDELRRSPAVKDIREEYWRLVARECKE